ncbi:cytochrome c oxidase-assembly factor COX23, mitochondrial, partial [Cyphellophora europaea CBS 101466]
RSTRTPSDGPREARTDGRGCDRKRSSEYHDPCQDFANRSIRCLHRNGGDKDMCQDYFQAYRDCKKEWTTKRR